MQGKNKRGREEINIIDVHGDDQISQVDLMKHMTEEKEMRSFSKKRKDLPSSQQRRKHQITYLAHEVPCFTFDFELLLRVLAIRYKFAVINSILAITH